METRVIIVTQTDLFADMLVRVMTDVSGFTISTVTDLDDVSIPQGADGEKPLLLVDVRTASVDELVISVAASQRGLALSHYIALFNLERDTGIEQRALHAGVRGFFYRDERLELILKGINSVAAGEVWVSRDVLVACALNQGNNGSSSGKDLLTNREIDVLLLVCVGKSNDEIAEELYISANTVRTHMQNIFKKINVPNRFQAALWASKNL